jgi:hypothetical protein
VQGNAALSKRGSICSLLISLVLICVLQHYAALDIYVQYGLKTDFESGTFNRALPPLRFITSSFRSDSHPLETFRWALRMLLANSVYYSPEERLIRRMQDSQGQEM